MGIRSGIIDYSRGNDLTFFFCLYRKQQKSRGMVRDILTFFMSRSAHRHGGYIGPDAVIRGKPSLPHGLHGVFISRYAQSSPMTGAFLSTSPIVTFWYIRQFTPTCA